MSWFKPLVKEGLQQGGKAFTTFLEEGLQRTDQSALTDLAARNFPEFKKWWGHANNYATNGEKGALVEMINIQDNAIRGQKAAKVEQDVINAQTQELTNLRAEGERVIKTRGGQDRGISALSTGPELISGDKRIYQLSSKLREPYKEWEELISANPVAKEFHHKFNKAISVPYFERAWELVDAKQATPEDIIAMHQYILDKGVPAGDRQSAMMMFERIPHNEFHEFIRSIGLEPRAGKFEKTGVTSKYSKTPGRKLRSKPSTDSPLKMEQSRIKNLKTIEDLAADFQKTVDETIVPMNREAELLQEAWQAIDIGLRDELMDVWNKRNMARKAGNKQVADTLNKRYKALKTEAISQMKTNRASYGQELDEFGNPDPESYGRAERMKELKEEKLQRQQGG